MHIHMINTINDELHCTLFVRLLLKVGHLSVLGNKIQQFTVYQQPLTHSARARRLYLVPAPATS